MLLVCLLTLCVSIADNAGTGAARVSAGALGSTQVEQPLDVFDRYTEEALQSVLFARLAVSELGGDAVTPTHLLLGLLQSKPETVGRFLAPPALAERLVAELRERIRVGGPMSLESDDVPLSPDALRVLHEAADEAGSAGGAVVHPEHVLLALLSEPAEPPLNLLRAHGVSETEVRAYLKSSRPGR